MSSRSCRLRVIGNLDDGAYLVTGFLRPLLAIGNGSSINRCRQLLEGEFVGWFYEFAFQTSRLVRHQKGGGIVQTFPKRFLAEDFISLGVRCIPEFGKHFVMRLTNVDSPRRRVILFQKHQVTEEGLHLRLERPFLVRPPEVVSVAHRFLDTIVEIVPVRRPRVGFDFDARQQVAVRDDE